jgi:hypothetical protein
MNSLPDLSGQPRPLKVRVKDETRIYMVYPLTVDDIASLQCWVDAQFPDPYAVASEAIAKHDFSVTMQQFILNTAMQAATRRNPIGTPEADRVLFGFEGSLELMKLAIRKGKPDFTDDEAREVRLWMTLADLAALEQLSGAEMVRSDPKQRPTTSGENGVSTSPARRRRQSTGGGSITRR